MDDLEGQDIFAQDFIQEEAAFEAMSDIQQFFDGTTVLVTGCTSFLGKCLIEKLMRSTDVKKIYALVRSKNGKTSSERMKKIFDSQIFESLKVTRPGVFNNIFAVPGDVAQPNLGLSIEDRAMLLHEVDLMFHLAGSSPFDRSLRTAVLTNICGTKAMLQLAKDMRCMKAAIFLSSVFSNCVNPDVEEKFYPAPLGHCEILQLLDILDDNCLKVLQPTLMNPWPNAFVFTKQVAENIIEHCSYGLPIGIIRPGLVSSVAFQPLKGFVEDLNGPQSVVYGCYSGFLRAVRLNKASGAPITPVDMVTNSLLALAWDLGVTRRDGPNLEQLSYNDALLPEDSLTALDVPILNLIPSSTNDIKWGTFMDHCLAKEADVSIKNKIRVATSCFSTNIRLIRFFQVICHWIPFILGDLFLKTFGGTPFLVDRYKKVNKIMNSCSYIYTLSWNFHDANAKKLWKKLSRKDKVLFNFNIGGIEWFDYMDTYMKGIRKYIAKDDVNFHVERAPNVFIQFDQPGKILEFRNLTLNMSLAVLKGPACVRHNATSYEMNECFLKTLKALEENILLWALLSTCCVLFCLIDSALDKRQRKVTRI